MMKVVKKAKVVKNCKDMAEMKKVKN